MKTSVTMDDMALHAAQDGIHRIEIHIQTLQGRRERLLADRHAALSPAMQQLRPSIPGEKYYPRNALMNGELLALLGESHPNAEQIHAQWSTLLPGTEMDTPDALLRRLADERRDKNDTTDPLPALMDMLHRIAAEGVRYSEG